MVEKKHASQPIAGTDKELPWLVQDVNRAAQILTGLSLSSLAQAALIIRNGELWAYAGQLPQEAASELGKAVVRYWDSKGEGDLVRYIRLGDNSTEQLMYATRLAKGMVLSLVFDSETPFSTIRTQTAELVRSLSLSPEEEGDMEDEMVDSTPKNGDKAPASFSNVPSSGPIEGLELSQEETDDSTPSSPIDTHSTYSFPRTLFNRKTSSENSFGDINQSTLPEKENFTTTNTNTSSEIGRHVIFEPDSQVLYNLDYACLMIPRLPTHFLKGDLAERLKEWVPTLCVAFAWRLEYLSVYPEYLQWIVNVPPTSAPGYIMRIVRQHISEKIFNEFPRLKDENPSGDFWAPGYVLMGGNHPHPAQLVKDFIQQTRMQQGIS
ncbi:MAG: transposase [Chloroflexota bacterium]